MNPARTCPDEATFVKYVHRQLADEERAQLISHVGDCSGCRRLLAGSVKALLPQPAEADSEEIAGRYRLGALVGVGAMGVVCEAEDSRLKRKVALKLIRRLSGPRLPDQRERLVREAESLARLSHPNIVAVYDAGAVEDQLFIAMELVRGGTLTTWCAAEKRDWRQILAMFLGAGRGLAAAHRAGLVHRDFKPDNVLVGEDGRPRVADFGLARICDQPVEPPRASGEQSPSLALTLTGTQLGTPRYMSPEQHQGSQADARSDQFSFAVALYDALYGEHPFDSSSPAELSRSVGAGIVRPAPPRSPVPSWLRQVVLRALSVDAARRFPSIDALLAAADDDPTRARRRAWSAVSLIALVALGAWGLHHWEARKSLVCKGGERKLAGVWDEPRRQALRASFAATGLPEAAATAEQSVHLLDAYAGKLVAGRTDACEAAQLRREQSPEVEDLRMSCLDKRGGELRALSELFQKADVDMVRQALHAVDGLGDLSQCSDVAALKAPLAPPADPALRKRIDALSESIGQQRALALTAKIVPSYALAKENAAAARAIGWPPLTAQALLELSYAADAAGDYAAIEGMSHDALEAAEAGHSDELVGKAASALASKLALDGKRYDEARTWARFSQAALQRAGNTPEMATRAERTFGYIDIHQWRVADALPHYQRALAILEKAGLGDTIDAALALRNLGTIALEQVRYDDADANFSRSLALYQKHFGPDHPSTIELRGALGSVAHERGHWEESRKIYEDELVRYEKIRGPDHPENVEVLDNLANNNMELHDPEAALRYYRRSLAISEKHNGPDAWETLHTRFGVASVLDGQLHFDEARRQLLALLADEERLGSPLLPETLNLLADLCDDELEPAQARAYYLRAIALSEKARGPNHPEVGMELLQLAGLGGPQAVPLARRALAIFEKDGGPDHIYTRSAAGELGRALLAAGDAKAALLLLERTAGDESRMLFYHFPLAQALVQTGGDRKRARKLALGMLAHAREYPTPKYERLAGQITEWLAANK